MLRGRKRGRIMYKEVDAEVEIGCDDVIDYINDYASENELKHIAQAIADSSESSLSTDGLFEDRGMDGGYMRREKLELLSEAYHKFSLSELEERLGTKFNLK